MDWWIGGLVGWWIVSCLGRQASVPSPSPLFPCSPLLPVVPAAPCEISVGQFGSLQSAAANCMYFVRM